MKRGYAHALEEVTIDGRPALIKRRHHDSWSVDLRTWDEAETLHAIAEQGIRAPVALGLHSADGGLLIDRLPGVAIESQWPRGTPLPPGAIADITTMFGRLASVPLTRLPRLPEGRPAGDDTAGFFALLLCHTAGLMGADLHRHAERLRAIEVDDVAFSAVEAERARLVPRTLRLCHGDLNRNNLLHQDGRIWVVDWELATLGDPAWDVAVLIHRGGLVEEDVSALQAGLRSVHPEPPAEENVVAYLALERLRSLLVDAVRYHERGMQNPEEREYLTRRFTAKLRQARPHRTWSEQDVDAVLFGS